MEKLLAMSILSSSPAEISGLGLGFGSGSWMMNMSLFKNNKTSEAADKNSGSMQRPPSSQGESKGTKQGQPEQKQEKGPGLGSGLSSSLRPRQRTWFAPEFDGLNCFETIVSH